MSTDNMVTVAAGSDRPRGRHRRQKTSRRWFWKRRNDTIIVSSDDVDDDDAGLDIFDKTEREDHGDPYVPSDAEILTMMIDTALVKMDASAGDTARALRTFKTLSALSDRPHVGERRHVCWLDDPVVIPPIPTTPTGEHRLPGLPDYMYERDTESTRDDMPVLEHTSDGRLAPVHVSRTRTIVPPIPRALDETYELRQFEESNTGFFDAVSRTVVTQPFKAPAASVDPTIFNTAMSPAVVHVIRYCVHCGTMRSGVVVHDSPYDVWFCVQCNNGS